MSRHRWEPAELRDTWRCVNDGCTAYKYERPHPFGGSKFSEYWTRATDSTKYIHHGTKAPTCPYPKKVT